MPACEFGTQIKPGQDNAFWLTGEAVCAALGTLWTPYAGFVCSALVPLLIRPSEFCASVPPDPLPNPFDDVLTTGLLPTPADVWAWAVSVWRAAEWNTYCQCSTGNDCGESDASSSFHETTTLGFTGPISAYTALPVGATSYVKRWLSWNTDPDETVFHTIQMRNSSGSVTLNVNTSRVGDGSNSDDASHTIPAGSVEWRHFITNGTHAVGQDAAVSVSMLWSGNCTVSGTPYVPPTLAPPPADLPEPPQPTTGCTTDDVCTRVQQLQNMLSIIATEVDEVYLWTLTPTIPPAGISAGYTLGTAHAGLTGSGSVNVSASAIRGLLVSVTARPGYLGSSDGTPVAYFDEGFITPGDANGWGPSRRLMKDSQLLVDQFNTWTRFGWELRPGVTVTVTELIPT